LREWVRRNSAAVDQHERGIGAETTERDRGAAGRQTFVLVLR
jgi:hypothetical protein